MKVKIIFFLAAAICLTGCKAILLKMYGIKDPKVETAASIKHYALKTGLDTASIVSVNAADFQSVLRSGKGIPDASLFDRNGDYIEYRETDTSCNAGLFRFIPNLSAGGTYNKTGKLSLPVELKKMRTLSGLELPRMMNDTNDFYLLIYWTKWTGKLNEDHVRDWQNLAKANKAARISVIEVNLDVQTYWTKEDQDKIFDSFKKKK